MSDDINKYLLEIIPEEELDRVFGQEYCDITPEFMGFVSTYYHLSQIIPEHWTVIDFGAAYNPQSYFFTKHKKYIAVEVNKFFMGDTSNKIEWISFEMFQPDNCEIYQMTTGDFIKKHLEDDYDLEETFAICNYVPPWYEEDSGELVRKYFPNAYVFYPSNKEQQRGIVQNIKKKLYPQLA